MFSLMHCYRSKKAGIPPHASALCFAYVVMGVLLSVASLSRRLMDSINLRENISPLFVREKGKCLMGLEH